MMPDKRRRPAPGDASVTGGGGPSGPAGTGSGGSTTSSGSAGLGAGTTGSGGSGRHRWSSTGAGGTGVGGTAGVGGALDWVALPAERAGLRRRRFISSQLADWYPRSPFRTKAGERCGRIRISDARRVLRLRNARAFLLARGSLATLPGSGSEPLPGRDVIVAGAPLPYMWNRAKNADGLDVVYMNCLQCHAGKFNGKLVVGLGNADSDWTTNLGGASAAEILLLALLPTPQEQAEIEQVPWPLEGHRAARGHAHRRHQSGRDARDDVHFASRQQDARVVGYAPSDHSIRRAIARRRRHHVEGAALVAHVQEERPVLQRDGSRGSPSQHDARRLALHRLGRHRPTPSTRTSTT